MPIHLSFNSQQRLPLSSLSAPHMLIIHTVLCLVLYQCAYSDILLILQTSSLFKPSVLIPPIYSYFTSIHALNRLILPHLLILHSSKNSTVCTPHFPLINLHICLSFLNPFTFYQLCHILYRRKEKVMYADLLVNPFTGFPLLFSLFEPMAMQ